ncbi:MAG TPA: carbohydrate kinase family protein [Candidatus Saccharimonadales bacterium]|nr:carbohydrate kinase family protein [Candidatus Saccharimonadales bacterium]
MIYDFITIGGATRDISFFTDQGILINNSRDILRQQLLAFEYGAKIRIDTFNYTYGGGAANAAVNLSHFGFKTACLVAIGSDDNGQAIIKNLKDRQVGVSLVKKISAVNSGFSFIIISKTGERIIFTERGANNLLKLTTKDEAMLKNTKNIYISSLSGNWKIILQKVFALAYKQGTRITWNPSEAQYSVGLKKLALFLKNTFIFSVNKDEAIELALAHSKISGQKLDQTFLNDEKNLLKIIKSYGPKIVLITSGAAGAYVYDGFKFYYQPIYKEKKRVDTTGVGDIFNSTFAAGVELFKGDIKKALHLSARNTASKIEHLGAQNGLLKIKL